VSGEKLYYIYIDTKINGTFEQLKQYFQTRIFDNDRCICVLVKYYKEIESVANDIFTPLLINYKLIKKNSDLDLLPGKSVFYLFNAQSNCRVVANRKLSHIFVTHGESHKLASIKPILRIYDHIICSGQVSIDRFLKSSIFNKNDIADGKIITLGNTFIGSNEFSYSKESNNLVYAPTWEGGIPEEDFCSISKRNINKIIDFCKEQGLSRVIIKPHPNLGHRLKSHRNIINDITDLIKKSGLNASIHDNRKEKPKKVNWNFFKKEKINEIKFQDVNVRYAITDISAMEAQFISKNIPCSVLVSNESLEIIPLPKLLKSQSNNNFILDRDHITHSSIKTLQFLRDYYFSYPEGLNEESSIQCRIEWLCQHAEKSRVLRIQNSWLKY
jgi:hypothetical protein